ncbi:hypothetical protein GCM10023168_26200 [Fodinibacter luteus]|uniref:Flp family type IVb pilin n=1 Tax=Fodinibacter luteus TaxID=552064 RepID=A0ABP8KLB8_9MICO
MRAKLTSENGATAVEYGLLVALIAAVVMGLIATLGAQLLGIFAAAASYV